MSKEPKTFWITNISNKNVSLGDLNMTVKAFATINLLDSKHYHYNEEQLKKSALNGSIYSKRDKIFVRKVPPTIEVAIMQSVEANIPSRQRSIVEVKYETYEELNVSDEEWAAENADIVELDSHKG